MLMTTAAAGRHTYSCLGDMHSMWVLGEAAAANRHAHGAQFLQHSRCTF
jgi:hypothetical protein